MSDADRATRHRLFKIVGFVLLALLLGELVYFAVRWPFTQERVLRALRGATRGTVTAKSFDLHIIQPGCTLRGVRIASPAGAFTATADAIVIRSSWMKLLRMRKEVSRFELQRLQARIDIKGRADKESGGGEHGSKTPVEEFVADGAKLEFVSGPDDERPLEFPIQRLRITNWGPNRRLGYSVVLTNPHPPGEIAASGFVGPIAPGRAGMTPVSGTFELRHAKLDRYKGLNGTVFAKGKFSGPLAAIAVEGTASVRGFEVNNSRKPVELQSQYRAAVNGRNGDVTLKEVEARFLSTHLDVSGSVASRPGTKGKTARLKFVSREARIDDLLLVFTRSEVSNLQGPMRLRGHVALPSGKEKFLRRVQLEGTFDIDDARWTRAGTQNKVDELSARARGDKEEFKNHGALAQGVLTDLSGSVTLKDGVASLRNVVFQVPGAAASGGGTYNLITKRVDLTGTVRMAADVSEATSGIKSILLRPFNMLFRRKRQDEGATLPVSIVGTYPRPQYKVGLTR